MAKLNIPDELKADMPQSAWGKILIATPVVMTVVATALAGLASSEMTRAQYSRSLAAQQQSKAGDQWGFFQAKRLRSAMQHSTLDLLQSSTEVHPLDVQSIAAFGVTPDSPDGPQTLAALTQAQLPEISLPQIDPQMKAAVEAIAASKPEQEITSLVARVPNDAVVDALQADQGAADAFDAATKPVNRAIERIDDQVSRMPTGQQAGRDFIAARLRYTASRYDAEARLNQAIAYDYEVQVRKSNLDAEHHHRRSQRFFYGMLGAQMAVIISTFSLAARKRSLLWSLAAAAGAAAVGFAIYVYLFF